MTAFFIIIVLLAAMAAVIWPVIHRYEPAKETLVEDMELGEVLARKDAALLAIDELESDYRMGNLSGADYAELRHKYDEQAMSALRTLDEVRGVRDMVRDDRLDDEIESRVAARREARKNMPASVPSAATPRCPSCGRVLAAGAAFCAYCGAALGAACPACAASVAPGDKFCGRCGTALGPVPAE